MDKEKELEEAAAQARRDYVNQWRKNNPEKVKKYNADYWRRKAEKNRKEAEANESADN